MDCNDLNRRVRYALMLDDADVMQLLSLAAFDTDIDTVTGWRLKEGEPGHLACPPQALRAMLDGLIVQRRGPREEGAPSAKAGSLGSPGQQAAADARQLDNNDVLKQLRIALSLKTDEVFEIIAKGGGKIGKGEVNALFRKPSARNYRRCGDQVLRWFLAGLAAQRTT